MEEPKPNNKPVPGIAEALHPEIGNGSALETDKHSFILRTPEPSMQLAEYLSPSDEDASAISKPSTVTEETASQQTLSVEENASPIPVSQPEEVFPATKGSKKRKSVKGNTSPDTKEAEPADSEPAEGKPQKAGKLLRKAAKSVKKQEEKLKEAFTEKSERPGLALSPFTSWLKKLTGSDYVHPYEDDFAFEQASGSGKEGISETYADLLAAQGYKDQAREMYIKLMEKYPEKSGFFAAKLEALQ